MDKLFLRKSFVGNKSPFFETDTLIHILWIIVHCISKNMALEIETKEFQV